MKKPIVSKEDRDNGMTPKWIRNLGWFALLVSVYVAWVIVGVLK